MQVQRNDKQLVISIHEEERNLLRELEANETLDSDESMIDFFESLICNGDLNWVTPEETGDLTSAPILAELGDEMPGPDAPPPMARVVGAKRHSAGFLETCYRPVKRRWAFMDYEVISVLRRLLNDGKVVFVSGN